MDDEFDVIPETPIKRRRGRPPKTVQAATVEIEDADEKPVQRRTRRSSKVTVENVVGLTCQGFALVALVTRRPHWLVDPSEVKPWASSAAELLNSIPSRYIKAFANTSNYVAVGIGLYGVVAPRIAIDQTLRREAAAAEPETVVNGASAVDDLGPLFRPFDMTQPTLMTTPERHPGG